MYFDGIKMLNQLEEKVNLYAYYYDIYVDSLSIKERLQNEITEEELNKCITQLLNFLNELKSKKIDDYHKVSYIFDEIYGIILYVMKIEILRNGKSILFDMIKKSQNDRTMISNLIRKDMEMMGYRENNNSLLFEIFEKMGINKTNFDYYDERLIFILGIFNNEELDCHLPMRFDEFEKSLERVHDENSKLSGELKPLKDKLDDAKEAKTLTLREGWLHIFLSLLLVGSMALSGYGAFRLGKRSASNVMRNTTITSCSSLSDEYVTKDGMYTKYKKGDIYLQDVSWYDYDTRRITTYWIRPDKNSVKFDDLKEYLDYEELFYSDYFDKEVDYVDITAGEFLSDDNYTVVGEVTGIDRKDKLIIRDTSCFGFVVALSFILYALIWAIILVLLAYFDILEGIFDYSDFEVLEDYKRYIDEYYEEYMEKMKELKMNEEEMMQIDKMYQEINSKYGELMDLVKMRKGKTRKLSE